MTYDTINDAATIAGGSSAGAMLAGRYRVVRQLGQGGMGSVWLFPIIREKKRLKPRSSIAQALDFRR